MYNSQTVQCTVRNIAEIKYTIFAQANKEKYDKNLSIYLSLIYQSTIKTIGHHIDVSNQHKQIITQCRFSTDEKAIDVQTKYKKVTWYQFNSFGLFQTKNSAMFLSNTESISVVKVFRFQRIHTFLLFFLQSFPVPNFRPFCNF